jgi:hypothetical protein
MTTSKDRLQILELLRDGRITSDEATRLLQALQSNTVKATATTGGNPRWVRIKVTDLRSAAVKFNISLPTSLVKVGLRMGAQFGTGDVSFDTAQVMEAIRSGAIGKIAELLSEEENERVEIWLE